MSVDVERFRALLHDERKRVASAIENIRHENPGADESDELSSADDHIGDIATETLDREMASTLQEHETQVLAAIDAALERIDDGTYGKCASCGTEIPEERLEARPWARLCIDCKRKEERG